MDKLLRKDQLAILKAFSADSYGFALAGGTALELFYLHHRFSADLDFFCSDYSADKVERVLLNLTKALTAKIRPQSEIDLPGRARIKVFSYSSKKKASRVLKIDFVEETLIKKPRIRRFSGIPVYDARDIYYQKLSAIAGTSEHSDEFGRDIQSGRNQPRDVFDVYMLSRMVMPLSNFLIKVPASMQRRIVHWYRNFSRQDLKLGLMELEIYDSNFDAREMIIYIENEVKDFMKKVIE
jgi:predicted nucleotidyltransferase component of viral defense system